MNLIDWIIVAVVLGIIVVAVIYIRKEKKNGAKCIGCPMAKQCGGNCNGNCSEKIEDVPYE